MNLKVIDSTELIIHEQLLCSNQNCVMTL